MPTKTDRILSYLPRTFQTTPRPKALYAVVDAFGNELLLGENSLAEIMLTHWVDFADKDSLIIDDLAEIAKLYGLAPQREEDFKSLVNGAAAVKTDSVRSHTAYRDSLETVEEFREHLKRYVRTFLEGTVTVQGILRVTAEALGLRIADETRDLDRWWTRRIDEIVSVEGRNDDAGTQLRFEHTHASGTPARPAQVTGNVNLSTGIEVTEPAILRLKVDGRKYVIDLANAHTLPARLSLEQIVDIINQSPRPHLARQNGSYLTLASPLIDPTSSLELMGGDNDVAPRLLGLARRSYHGTAATAAQVVGTPDLSQGVNLTTGRFLRIEIDGKHLVEIDCAGQRVADTRLDDIRKAIDQGFEPFGFSITGDDGQHLILTSPSRGLQSAISVQPPAAQNAAVIILGAPTVFKVGQNDRPARVNSPRDLRGTVDLSERSNLRLRIDGGPEVAIDCAGVDPSKTQRIEIVDAINTAFGAEIANVTEHGISLNSPTLGPASAIVFEDASPGDASNDLFGIGVLTFEGSAPTRARIASKKIDGFNPWRQNVLSLAIDGATPIEINLRRAAKPFRSFEGVSVADFVEKLESVALDDLVTLINQSLNANIAATDGERLLLNSTTTGGASSLEIKRLETARRRRFLTRAIVTDDAASVIFGFNAKDAQGTPAKAARIVGNHDLSQSEDLTKARLLRLRVDGYDPCEIDCAGPRPRATTLDEIVKQINTALGAVAGVLKNVASQDGKNLLLISPTTGADSSLAIEPPHAALEQLLGVEPETVNGQDATQVKFISTVDLSSGIDLDPNAAIKLGIDDKAPVEISLAGPAPNHKTILEISTQINTTLGVFAGSDGKHLVLTSAKAGAESKLVFDVPSAHDVTQQIFGVVPPRAYQGEPATPARIVGKRELNHDINLSALRFLSLAVDGGRARDIDCAARAAKPQLAKLAEIVNSINTELRLAKDIASDDGTHLILTSPTLGVNSQIRADVYTAGDASKAVLGDAGTVEAGAPAAPASITGEKTVLAPVDLSKRSRLRLAVNDGRPQEVDVAGKVPAKTFLDEIIAAINRAIPNLAFATDDDQLKLISPSGGEESRLSVLPLRYLDVVEYIPEEALPVTVSARHGKNWRISNSGAADTYAEIKLTAPQGAVGPTIVNSNSGWSVRLFAVIEVGDFVELRRNLRGELEVEITSPDGTKRFLPGSQVLVGPLGSQAWVPFKDEWRLIAKPGQPTTLQLNNPLASSIVLLRARKPTDVVAVSVIESDLAKLDPPPLADGSSARLVGRVAVGPGGFQLVDGSGSPIAELRAGPYVNLSAHWDRVVKVTGPFHDDTLPLIIVQAISELFDVAIHHAFLDTAPEKHTRVTIGEGQVEEDSLARQINVGSRQDPASALVSAGELDKATILSLPRGVSNFRYLDCLGSRFNHAKFDHARFPNGVCGERGVFDVSRLVNVPPELVTPVFASADPMWDPPVTINFRWTVHQPGTFIVNLPADLPARFGARFNEARFSQLKEKPEVYEGAVAEPLSDPKFLATLIGDGVSDFLQEAQVVTEVPLGWSPVKMPFRKPQFLTLGKPGQAARLYLAEAGLTGFIQLEAKADGEWGNEIAVAARQSGHAIYDVSVIYSGGRFENACSVVLGQPAPELTQAVLKPGPIGVLQAKAAGVRVGVTRDRAEFEELKPSSNQS